MLAARTILTGFVALFTLAVISGCTGAPDVSGQWKGSVELNGEPAGLEVNLNIGEGQGDGRSVYGGGTVTFVEEGSEQEYPLNITSGKIGGNGNLNFTTEENSRFPRMTFQASAGSSRIQGNVVTDSGDANGGPFELAQGEQGEKLLADTIKQAREGQKQQQAASDLENLDSKLGKLLYGIGEGSGGLSNEPQSVEAAIEAVESNATALGETLESTVKADTEDRESANEDVQEVLEDYRDGETSTEEACSDIDHDRSDFSRSDGISDGSTEEYRQARDTLKQSEQSLDQLMANAKETLKELKSARENAADDAPIPRFGEGDVRQLGKDAEAVHEQADSALKETKEKFKEYEKRAQKASDQAVDAFDEIGIDNDTSCSGLSDETTTGQDDEGTSSETEENNATTTGRTRSGPPFGTQSPE